jgi:hypothetical protein
MAGLVPAIHVFPARWSKDVHKAGHDDRQDRVRQTIGQIDAETPEQFDRALLVVLGLAR